MTSYYAVVRGRKQGIFTNFEYTTSLVKGYKAGLYRKFPNRKQANDYYKLYETPVYLKKVSNHKKKTSLRLYTDGGCYYANKDVEDDPQYVSAYSFGFLYQEKEIYFSKLARGYDSHDIEAKAIYEALSWLYQSGYTKVPIILNCDNMTILDAIDNCFIDISFVSEILDLMNKFDSIIPHWVKGHSYNRFNNKVDELCNQEIDNFLGSSTKKERFERYQAIFN